MGVAGRARMVRHVRLQATACGELGSPLYLSLLHRVADDVVAGGPAAAVLAGHERDPGPSALALRLMGATHRLALQGRAPALAACYPSTGGRPDAPAAWPALRDLLVAERDEIRKGLLWPPQTNEVGRAAALLGGLVHLQAADPRPVRLFEVGASAGLNLRADQFRVADGLGPNDSPVVLTGAWAGRPPPVGGPVDVVERAGCDPAPLDPTDPADAERLTSYVWPDQRDRLARLRGAIELARSVPASVVRAGARDFVAGLRLASGATTVLWHSVVWQYLDRDERADVTHLIEGLGASASEQAPFAHLSLEPRRRTPGSVHEFLVVLRRWPGGAERVLGTAHPHGLPTVWA